MGFANFAEDDPFGDVNAAGAPESPVRVAIPRDLDIDEVNQLERVRREKLQTLIEEKRAVAKNLHALKCAAEVSATLMEVPSTPGASSADIPAMARAAGIPQVHSDTVSMLASRHVDDPGTMRLLNRHISREKDPPPLPTAMFPKRRRLTSKCPNNVAGSFPYSTPVTLPLEVTPIESTPVEVQMTAEDEVVANHGILSDSVIGAALADLSEDILTNKMINTKFNRNLCRQAVIRHCRELLLLKIERGLLGLKAEGMTTGRKLQWGASQYLTMMSDVERCRLYRCIIDDLRTEHKDSELLAFLCYLYRKEQPLADEDGFKEDWMKAKTVVLTYQGQWGVIPWTDELRNSKDDVKKLCKSLSDLPQVQELFTDACSLCTASMEEHRLKQVHCSIELCTKTLRDDDILRVHVHIALEARWKRKIRVKHPSRLAFRNSWPNKSSGENDAIQTRSATAGASCAYYLRMPKIGMVLNWGTTTPNEDFRINPDWILAYVQSGKITPEDAKIEVSKTWKNCKFLIENIEWNVAWQEKLKLQAFVASQQELLAAKRAKRKYRAEIDDDWLPHMAENLDRHKVLVLGGRSRTGKTTACKLMSSPIGYLEINCKGLTVQANLRPVNRHTELINFDEASLQWCLDNKKILQGPEVPVTMGDSATGMFAYDRLLHNIKMVVCSNTWRSEFEKLTDTESIDYIEQNFVYVHCDEVLYETPVI